MSEPPEMKFTTLPEPDGSTSTLAETPEFAPVADMVSSPFNIHWAHFPVPELATSHFKEMAFALKAEMKSC